jgi:hypothetical protein
LVLLTTTLCHGHKEPQEPRLKMMFKSNFQTRNKTRLCDSKIKTQDLITRTRDVHDKCEDESLLC